MQPTKARATNGQTSLFRKSCEPSSGLSGNQPVVLNLGDTRTFLPTIPDETVRLVITSPPYNIGKQYETKVEINSYLEQQEAIVDDLVRILAHDRSLCWQVGNYVENAEVFPLDIFYYRIFKKRGLKLRNRIIWHFEHGLHASKRFSGR